MSIWVGLILVIAGVLVHAFIADPRAKMFGMVLAVLGLVVLLVMLLVALVGPLDMRPVIAE